MNEKQPAGPSRFQANFFLLSIENDRHERGFAGASNPNSDRPMVPGRRHNDSIRLVRAQPLGSDLQERHHSLPSTCVSRGVIRSCFCQQAVRLAADTTPIHQLEQTRAIKSCVTRAGLSLPFTAF